jgi:hypothetical protein
VVKKLFKTLIAALVFGVFSVQVIGAEVAVNESAFSPLKAGTGTFHPPVTQQERTGAK